MTINYCQLFDVLENDPAAAEVLLNIVVTAWPRINHGTQVAIVELVLTPEYRAELRRRVAAAHDGSANG